LIELGGSPPVGDLEAGCPPPEPPVPPSLVAIEAVPPPAALSWEGPSAAAESAMEPVSCEPSREDESDLGEDESDLGEDESDLGEDELDLGEDESALGEDESVPGEDESVLGATASKPVGPSVGPRRITLSWRQLLPRFAYFKAA